MFSRRHPYLFFILIFSAIGISGILGSILLIVSKSDRSDFGKGDKVGVIEIIGPIADSKAVLEDLKKFREASSIKAIVVRINSPGGGVGPSQEIYREIQKVIKEKIVVASMGAIAASGGYYIAAGSNKIVANPGTITGSIGVIMGYTNLEKLFEKIGLTPVVIKSGEYKDIGSPARTMTSSEKAFLQRFTNLIHQQFVKAIAQGRNLEQTEVEKIADGRILTGEEAKVLGLVDQIGNFEDAVELAGRLGGIKGRIITVYPHKKKYSILKYLAESSAKEIFKQMLHSSFFTAYLYSPAF